MGVLRLMIKYLDDLLFFLGAALITIGAYLVCPVSALFVAGAFCIVAGVLIGVLMGKAKAGHVIE